MMDWGGQAVNVTDGASGLRDATASRLAADGLKVTVFNLNDHTCKAHAAQTWGTFDKVNVRWLNRAICTAPR